MGSVNKVIDSSAKPQVDTRKYYRCGGDKHLAKDCMFAKEKCHNCGKVGHIKRACRMKTVTVGKEKSKHVQRERGEHDRRADVMQEEEGDTGEVFTMCHMKASGITCTILLKRWSFPEKSL